MDTLFPKMPKDLKGLSDKEISDLLAEHEEAVGLIKADDPKFLGDLTADQIIEQYEQGADQILALRAEVVAREEAVEAFAEKKAAIDAKLEPAVEEPKAEASEEDEGEDGGEDESDDAEAEAEAEADEVSDPVAEKVLVTASADEVAEEPAAEEDKPRLRRVPVPAPDRVVVSEPTELAFVASGFLPSTPPGSKFESNKDMSLALKSLVSSLTPVAKRPDGREEKFKAATLDYSGNFPDERQLLAKDVEGNSEKIAAIGSPYFGRDSLQALVASGGLCAPLTPIYTMPNLAVADTPAWDSLPKFRAERGGVNVPTPTTIGDADGSITTITEAEDAQGGTFALKDCLDMSCPTYTETAVTIISACREFGNLNAMAWPEKIAHELAITRALHARAVETLILDNIKALSVNVTSGADTLGALIYLVDAITKSAFGIRSRLRMPREVRFQALLPAVALDILLLDTVQTQFDRYRTRGDIDAYLASAGIDVTYYLDTPSTGTSQIADTDQTAAAIDGFPKELQWAIFPQGTFLGIDMAELNLGIVRDSTLNSTNDFQYFWETFQNVARIGPAQAAYWETTNLCPVGTFPPAGTARTCES